MEKDGCGGLYNEVREIVRQSVVRIGITSNIWYDY